MGYKLAVKNVVVVPVKFSMPDEGKTKLFNFSITCERQTAAEFQAGGQDDNGTFGNQKLREQMLDITTGWTGQTFVLEDDGTPSAFCRDAFEFMLGVPGLLDVVVLSYMKESQAKAKN